MSVSALNKAFDKYADEFEIPADRREHHRQIFMSYYKSCMEPVKHGKEKARKKDSEESDESS